MADQNTNKPSLKDIKNNSGFFVDVMIPPECMDDEGDCPHSEKEDTKQYNPV